MNDKTRTHRKILDSDNFSKLLDAGANDAYKRPWHRLERGLRLNRLRLFTDSESERSQLSQQESHSLLQLLQKSLDKKILNSKTTVIYDQDEEVIKEIKGLVMHRGSDGIMKFQLLEKKTGAVTMRRKRDDSVAVQPTSQQIAVNQAAQQTAANQAAAEIAANVKNSSLENSV
jgi:hypothetical protein